MRTILSVIVGILLCGAGVFIYSLSGDMIVTIEGWRIQAPLWISILGVIGFSGVLCILMGGIRFLLGLPGKIMNRLAVRRLKKGYAYLNQTLTSYFAQNDPKLLDKCKEIEKLFPTPVVGLWCRSFVLKREARGHKAELTSLYKTLKNTEGGTFLGLFGLIQLAHEEGDRIKELTLLEEAHIVVPTSLWVKWELVKITLGEGMFEKAKTYLEGIQPKNAVDRERKKRLEAHLWVSQSQEAGKSSDEKRELLMEAYEACPGYGPAALSYGQELIRLGKRAKALSVIETAWKIEPQACLGDFYISQALGQDPLAAFEMARNLHEIAPHNKEGLFLMIEAALRAQLWGEAERYLGELGEAARDPRYYELQARWYEENKKDFEKARQWRREGLKNLNKEEPSSSCL